MSECETLMLSFCKTLLLFLLHLQKKIKKFSLEREREMSEAIVLFVLVSLTSKSLNDL